VRSARRHKKGQSLLLDPTLRHLFEYQLEFSELDGENQIAAERDEAEVVVARERFPFR
jgi:hypothetical protein